MEDVRALESPRRAVHKAMCGVSSIWVRQKKCCLNIFMPSYVDDGDSRAWIWMVRAEKWNCLRHAEAMEP